MVGGVAVHPENLPAPKSSVTPPSDTAWWGGLRFTQKICRRPNRASESNVLRQRCDARGFTLLRIENIARQKVAPAFEPQRDRRAGSPRTKRGHDTGQNVGPVCTCNLLFDDRLSLGAGVVFQRNPASRLVMRECRPQMTAVSSDQRFRGFSIGSLRQENRKFEIAVGGDERLFRGFLVTMRKVAHHGRRP
jgi:hypothetical protein